MEYFTHLPEIRNDSKAFWKQEKQRCSELREKHRVKDVAQQIFDKKRSALEREWREEKQRLKPLLPKREKGVKILWVEDCHFLPEFLSYQSRSSRE
jgi:hypothetical protein